MGHWEFMAGEFKLPTAEFARVRSAVAEADHKVKEEAFAFTQATWKSLTAKEKRDPKAYRAAVDRALPYSESSVIDLASSMMWRAAHNPENKPRRVLQSEADYPTNKTLTFSIDDAGIRFDRENSTVRFSTPEDRHVIERIEGSPVYQVLMKCIREMRWTRGTGGRIWTDNEYADEARRDNGGSSDDLTSEAFGPIGAENWPFRTRPWKNPKGESFYSEARQGKYGFQGRVKKGVPAGGQFSGRYRSEDSVSLGRW